MPAFHVQYILASGSGAAPKLSRPLQADTRREAVAIVHAELKAQTIEFEQGGHTVVLRTAAILYAEVSDEAPTPRRSVDIV